MKKPNEPKTPTEEQTNANRRNAAKSTGPRTTEGKAASSRNALKHGLCADQHLLPGEDPEDFRLLLDDLFGRFRPVGDGEETLVLRIAADQWRLDRALPMEAGIFRDRFHDVAAKEELRQQQYTTKKGYAEQDGEPVPPPPTPPVEGDLLARAFNVDCEGPNSFTKLARYESSIERSIDRCLRQLKAFQAARNNPPASGPQTGPEPPSAPPKTEDYETNPNDGGIDAGPAPPTDGPAETSPKNENDETNPKNEGSTTNHQPPATSRQPRRATLASRPHLHNDQRHIVVLRRASRERIGCRHKPLDRQPRRQRAARLRSRDHAFLARAAIRISAPVSGAPLRAW
jgi:hypothetical protein